MLTKKRPEQRQRCFFFVNVVNFEQYSENVQSVRRLKCWNVFKVHGRQGIIHLVRTQNFPKN